MLSQKIEKELSREANGVGRAGHSRQMERHMQIQRHNHTRGVQRIAGILVWLESEAVQTLVMGFRGYTKELRLIPKGTRELLIAVEQRSDTALRL